MKNWRKENREPDDANHGVDSRWDFLERIPERQAGDSEEVTPLFGKGVTLALLIWGVLVISITGGIASFTAFWPLLPIIGGAIPLAFAFLAVWHAKNQQEALRDRETYAALASEDRDEREVLGTLLRNDGLSPAVVAAHTSLGVSRAGEVLERLAGKGHLEVRALEGSLVYSLQGAEDPGPQYEEPSGPEPSELLAKPDEHSAAPRTPVKPLEEPLSEREFEVLRLLASGHTNREVAQKLYVAPGTVKAHIANIYRKLDARNRAEALERARHLELLN